MPRGIIVGLYAPTPHSGKTSLADHLQKHYGFVRMSFADTLKAMTITFLAEVLGDYNEAVRRTVSAEGKQEPILELGGITSRYIQQTLGTEWGRNVIHRDVWVSLGMAKARRYTEQGVNVVFDDVRFQNEMQSIVLAGGLDVRIDRPESASLRDTHASTGALDQWSFALHIQNADMTLERFLDFGSRAVWEGIARKRADEQAF